MSFLYCLIYRVSFPDLFCFDVNFLLTVFLTLFFFVCVLQDLAFESRMLQDGTEVRFPS